MKNILDLFTLNPDIQKIIKETNKEDYHIAVDNSTTNHNYLLASSIYQANNDFIFYVCTNMYKASIAYDTIGKILGYEKVNLYVNNEVVATEVDATNNEFTYERLSTINNLIDDNKVVIVTNIASICKEIMPIDAIKKNLINLKLNGRIKQEEFQKKLIKLGYHRVPTTSSVGDFSVRGEVIDIYPVNTSNPIRIDLFDDEIEKIKFFDYETQMSIKTDLIDNITIYPYSEIIYDNEKEIVKKIKVEGLEYRIERDKEDILNFNYSPRMGKYLHYIYDKTSSIIDYTFDKILLFDDVSQLKESYDKNINQLYAYFQTKPLYLKLDLAYFFDFFKVFEQSKIIVASSFKGSEIINYNTYRHFDINAYSIVSYQNNIKLLLEEIKKHNEKYVLTFTKLENYNLFKEILQNNHLEYKENDVNAQISMMILENSISFGFYNSVNVIDEANIYKKIDYQRAKYRSTNNKTSLINSYEDLKNGDYVVHYDYGIGRYLGIKTIQTQDVINDYISIQFANISLFIPVENINLIEKYQAEEGHVPKLAYIGSGDWEKKKQKIKEKLNSIAKELVLLQAIRDSKQGYQYNLDDEVQKAFEDDFVYDETVDQMKAIQDVKNDMEKGKIVDRLVCGDVGYGKTEVAIRAAMKTVLNGKQVAYLAPTTILTRQHYYTFKDRMEKYGVNVALLNRLISSKNKEMIIRELKQGTIDVVIGTHALLNDNISYRDLGLLIVDEEQRFGVVHKEKIKQYKNNINVITLTATPIPRTLQMSLVGARQMSLIESSPSNRYPVQTYVLEQNDSVIREAIYNELGRGGQVFYLHNRVLDINSTYDKIKSLVPEARIVIAHGQMNKNELENAIQEFINHKYDCLLCTTIIETGIDIPNTNTLIVERSNYLGLAQMYQIRGRVGRSDRVSYAYFMYDNNSILTSEGKQRLESLKEFTKLGSGYKIAMRDLAIRGAGDFLGREQSGYIDAIGMDLYMRLLNDNIKAINGDVVDEAKENVNMIEVSKHIDDNYVSDDDIKIYIHKVINDINSLNKKKQVIEELEDRFGKISEDVLIYIDKKYLDSLVDKLDIQSITENELKVKIVFSKDFSLKIAGKKMMEECYKMGEDFTLEYRNKRFIVYCLKSKGNKKWVHQVVSFLENLNN